MSTKSTISPHDEYVPVDAGVYLASDFGFSPDSGEDMSPKWKQMLTTIRDTITSGGGQLRTILLQDGVYEFDSPPSFILDGVKQSGIELIGTSRSGTILRLRENSIGFGDPYDSAKAFIVLESFGATLDNGFFNSIRQLTISVGPGNPSAIGLDYTGNNFSEVRNVDIRSEDGSGLSAIGIAWRGVQTGPGLFKHVRTYGFDYGISNPPPSGELQESMTYDDVEIHEPRIAGIRCMRVFSQQFRKIKYWGKGPGLVTRAQFAHTVCMDSHFEWTGVPGIDKAVSAIEIGGPDGGSSRTAHVLLRNCTSNGFQSLILKNAHRDTEPGGRLQTQAGRIFNDGEIVTGHSVEEYVSPEYSGEQIGEYKTIGLPVLETPELASMDPSDWHRLESFSGVTSGSFSTIRGEGAPDSLAGIQAAIDSGAKILYMGPDPTAGGGLQYYGVSGPVILRGDLQRIVSFGHGAIVPLIDYTGPVFILEDGTEPVVELMGQWHPFSQTAPQVENDFIHHVSSRTLILKHGGDYRYKSFQGAGDFFSEDCRFKWVELIGNRMFATQFNIEQLPSVENHFLNVGGDAWILGLKTEGGGWITNTQAGGRTEVYGGYVLWPTGDPGPLFSCEDSQHCLSFVTRTTDNPSPMVREVVGGVETFIGSGGFTEPGRRTPLYAGQVTASQPDPEPNPDPLELPELLGAAVSFDTSMAEPRNVLYTTEAGSTLLLVGLYTKDGDTTSATYNGVAMQPGELHDPDSRHLRFYWMVDPPEGEAVLSVQCTQTGGALGIIASSWKTVASGDPISESEMFPASGVGPSISVAAQAGQLIASIGVTNTQPIDLVPNGSGHIELADQPITTQSERIAMGYVIVSASGDYVLGWDAIETAPVGMVAGVFP